MENRENAGGSQQHYAEPGYRRNRYWQAVGPVALRAAERLIQRRLVGDSDGTTEAVPPLVEDWPEPAPDNGAPTEAPESRANARLVLANVYCDPKRNTVSFLMDDETANTIIYAVRLLAAESEAHAREVRTVRATLPPDSYGAANRHAIASRQERIAARLRVLEGNYRTVVSGDKHP